MDRATAEAITDRAVAVIRQRSLPQPANAAWWDKLKGRTREDLIRGNEEMLKHIRKHGASKGWDLPDDETLLKIISPSPRGMVTTLSGALNRVKKKLGLA